MTKEERLKEIRERENAPYFGENDIQFVLVQLDLAKAELLGYYRMATAGIWIETEKYGELLKERDLANKRCEILRAGIGEFMSHLLPNCVDERLAYSEYQIYHEEIKALHEALKAADEVK